jgi:hypothetical protein
MRKHLALVTLIVVLAACGTPDLVGGTSPSSTTTTLDPDQPVDSGDDEPIAEPGPVGSIPEPRLPIDGNIDGEVWVTSADLRIMESFPIQVMLDVTGEKPTPCHEVFWTAEDTGDAIEIEMISQIASDQSCTQVIEEFIVAVPLGSWDDEARDVYLNGELAGSFES